MFSVTQSSHITCLAAALTRVLELENTLPPIVLLKNCGDIFALPSSFLKWHHHYGAILAVMFRTWKALPDCRVDSSVPGSLSATMIVAANRPTSSSITVQQDGLRLVYLTRRPNWPLLGVGLYP